MLMWFTCKSEIQVSEGDLQQIGVDVKSLLFVISTKNGNITVLVTGDLRQMLWDGRASYHD
jgi:hypothetical protein